MFSAITSTISILIALSVVFLQRQQKRRDDIIALLKELPAGLPHASELKNSFWDWYPRNENANVTFQEVYAPWIRALGPKNLAMKADELEMIIVHQLFDIWRAQKDAGGKPTEEPTTDEEKAVWENYETKRKELRTLIAARLP